MTTRDIFDQLAGLAANLEAASKFSVAGVEALRQFDELLARIESKAREEEAFDASAGASMPIEPTELRNLANQGFDVLENRHLPAALIMLRAAHQIERERLAAADQVAEVRKAGQASEDAHAADVAALEDARRELDQLKTANRELALNPLSALRKQFPSADILVRLRGKDE